MLRHGRCGFWAALEESSAPGDWVAYCDYLRVEEGLAQAEAEVDRLRRKKQELNRRATQAEAVVLKGVEAVGEGSVGRAAARVAARSWKLAAEAWRDRAKSAEAERYEMLRDAAQDAKSVSELLKDKDAEIRLLRRRVAELGGSSS